MIPPDEEHEHHHEPGPWDDETAERYVEKWGDHPTNRMTVEAAGLAPDDVVLDIGCGSGAAVREAATRLTRGRVYGIDPTAAMVRIAKDKTRDDPTRERITFLEGAAAHVPLPDAAVTVVMAINSLHHWEDAASGLSEIRRVLRPNGRLVVSDEAEDDDTPQEYRHLKDPETVTHLIEEAGFLDVKVEKLVEGDVEMFAVTGRAPSGTETG